MKTMGSTRKKSWRQEVLVTWHMVFFFTRWIQLFLTTPQNQSISISLKISILFVANLNNSHFFCQEILVLVYLLKESENQLKPWGLDSVFLPPKWLTFVRLTRSWIPLGWKLSNICNSHYQLHMKRKNQPQNQWLIFKTIQVENVASKLYISDRLYDCKIILEFTKKK